MQQDAHKTLYITGAGVSAESGIPTFRGKDGFWTIGSRNYTPEQMATRFMYQHSPVQFLAWYYRRFAIYRDYGPNDVHYWLADKNLITQNIDGLDAKAGNLDYIGVHGGLDKMTLFHEQGDPVEKFSTPWDKVDENNFEQSLLDLFRIENEMPELYTSYKPLVLLFDEFYTELYQISEAQRRMREAETIIFMGTSFSVNITQMALEIAMLQGTEIEVVDPEPVRLAYDKVRYYPVKALDYIQNH